MVLVKLSTFLVALPLTAAWAGVMEMNEKMQEYAEPPDREPLFKSRRPNTSLPPVGFDAAEQYVNVGLNSGHEWKAPETSDLRGPCPGLNAAANHNFIPRNGLLSIDQTVKGLAKAFNTAVDLSTFLAVMSVAQSGDPIRGTWSIRGGFTPALPLYHPKGILGTHNRYEGDASFTRGDAYLNNGKVGMFQMRSWEKMYNRSKSYTLDDAAAQSDYNTRWSIMNNPYYFSGQVSGFVAPAAHNFVIALMSNHSAESPGGVLSRDVLKAFFAVTGDEPGKFEHSPGKERIPENWYKRPAANIYSIPVAVADVVVNNAMYPGIFRFGGNTGTTNSFAGIDLADFTKGLYNLASLAEGNKGACYLLQASMLGLPNILDLLLGPAGTILGWVQQQLGPLSSKFGCPELAGFDNELFNKFPGATYKTEGQ